jgi:hypothetical protein
MKSLHILIHAEVCEHPQIGFVSGARSFSKALVASWKLRGVAACTALKSKGLGTKEDVRAKLITK